MDEEFVQLVRDLLEKKAYSELFQRGCCFQFALRAKLRGLGELTSVYWADRMNPSHVFVINGDQVFDSMGFRILGEVKEQYYSNKSAPCCRLSTDEVETIIAVKSQLPNDLRATVDTKADEFIDFLLGATKNPASLP